MFSGLVQRLENQLISLAPSIEIEILAPPERRSSSFIGGSIFSSWSTFETMWISRKEYELSGPSIVHLKCL